MAAQTHTATAPATFNRAELRALRTLRARYQEEHDLFTGPETDRLRFLRWLVDTGRLTP